MKKLLFGVLTLALVTSAFAAEAKKPLTDAEKAALQEKRLQKTGGIVTKEGQGKIVVVNAQQKFTQADIERVMGDFRSNLKVNIEVRPGTWKLGDKLPGDAKVAIYIVDDAALPMSLVAMEARWGLMNVSALDGAKRFDRELVRVGIATLGGGVSQYKASPMQSISSPADLDALVSATPTVDASVGIRLNLDKIGVTASKMTTYRKACEEGWAATPTNDYQKAIWKEVHQLPTEPLKLTK